MTPAHLIRFAMLLGALLFGGVTWFVRRSGDGASLDADGARALLWAARGVWGVSMAACILLFAFIRNARSRERVTALSLAGWATGEAVALMGGVVWFLTGNPDWYTFGLVYLVLTFLAFPAPRA